MDWSNRTGGYSASRLSPRKLVDQSVHASERRQRCRFTALRLQTRGTAEVHEILRFFRKPRLAHCSLAYQLVLLGRGYELGQEQIICLRRDRCVLHAPE